MNLPAAKQNERPAAQMCPPAQRPLSRAARPAMISESATVPSCFYAADNYKTCYPSPIRRSASSLARPPFFAKMAPTENLTSRERIKHVLGVVGSSTGDAKQCAQNLHSQHFSRPHWPSQGATHPTLNAQRGVGRGNHSAEEESGESAPVPHVGSPTGSKRK